MHGKNYWGLYFVLNKSTQIFFGFTFQFHLKIAISITEMPGGGGGGVFSIIPSISWEENYEPQ